MTVDSLVTGSCHFHSGPLAYWGDITLFSERLEFNPTGRLDRMLGVQAHSVNLTKIKDIKCGGFPRALTFNIGDTRWKYSGGDIETIYRRLLALVSEPTDESEPEFQQNERVLSCGRSALLEDGLVVCQGELMLSDRRLRFQPQEGGNNGVEAIECNLSDVKKVTLVGIRRHLAIESELGNWTFAGVVTPVMFSLLKVKITSSVDESEGNRIQARWRAQLHSGPVTSPGELVVGNNAIHFEPEGRLDAAVGIKGLDAKLVDIDWLSCTGWPTRRLVIHNSEGEHLLTVEHPNSHFLDLLPLLTRARRRSEPKPGADGTLDGADAVKLIELWSSHISVGKTEQVLMGTPALYLPREWTAVRGWLILTSAQVLWVPHGKPRAKSAVRIRLSSVQPDGHADSMMDNLTFRVNDHQVEFMPMCGHSIVERFWAMRWKSVETDALNKDHGWLFHRMLGDAAFARVYLNDELLFEQRPAQLVQHIDGLGLYLEDDPKATFQSAQKVSLRVGSVGGIYTLTCTTLSVEDRSALQEDSDAPKYLLVLARHANLELNNRRNSFRADVKMAISGRIMARTATRGWVASSSAKPVRFMLRNLSMGGCAMTSKSKLEPKSRLMIVLPPRTSPLKVMVEVLSVEEQSGGFYPYRYRCRFVGLKANNATQINTQVMKYQRRTIQANTD